MKIKLIGCEMMWLCDDTKKGDDAMWKSWKGVNIVKKVPATTAKTLAKT